MTEIRAELQAAIATFSTGMVAVGDKIDETDLKLLHKSIMPNGRILKPSYPMVIPDYLIWTLDTKNHLNGTTEYETMCTVQGSYFCEKQYQLFKSLPSKDDLYKFLS